MCFGSSSSTKYNSPPPRRVQYGNDSYSQRTYSKGHVTYKKTQNRRRHNDSGGGEGGGDGGSGGGGGDGGGGGGDGGGC